MCIALTYLHKWLNLKVEKFQLDIKGEKEEKTKFWLQIFPRYWVSEMDASF